MIEPWSKRVNELGWHIQINMDADQMVAAEDMWMRLPSVIVFDNMGRRPEPIGVRHPAFTVIRRPIDKGRTWMKLSVSSTNPSTYANLTRLAQAYVQAAPERLVWGVIGPTQARRRYAIRLAHSFGTRRVNSPSHSR